MLVVDSNWYGNLSCQDINCLLNQNMFLTKEEAEKAIKQKNVFYSLYKKIREIDRENGWICDWSDREQFKYSILWDYEENIKRSDFSRLYNDGKIYMSERADNYMMSNAVSNEDFKLFLSKPYPIELGNIPNNPIIYRLVRLKNINDLRKNELGNSWFSNPNQIHEEGFFQMLDYLKPFKNKDGQVYIIKGQINKNNIDMKRTLWERKAWLKQVSS
jgi:hypothetical protein